MSLKVLEARDLKYGEGDDVLFQNVSLDLHLGQSLMLLADPPDATLALLKVCATLRQAHSGRIKWLNMFENLPIGTQLMVLRRQIGLVHRGTSLVSNLTLLDNMVLGIVYRDNLSPAQAYPQADELLERFGLYEFRRHRPAELKYEKKRIGAYVREMIKRPKLYLMETPLLDLDEDFEMVMNAVHQEVKAGRSALIFSDVTSNSSQGYADEILYMNHELNYWITRDIFSEEGQAGAEPGARAEAGGVET